MGGASKNPFTAFFLLIACDPVISHSISVPFGQSLFSLLDKGITSYPGSNESFATPLHGLPQFSSRDWAAIQTGPLLDADSVWSFPKFGRCELVESVMNTTDRNLTDSFWNMIYT